jgi:trehalose synthase-fused probable maltokinase
MPEFTPDDSAHASALQRYITAQRWFQRRPEPPVAVRLLATACVAPGLSWSVARVTHADGSCELYNLPLCTCPADEVPKRAIIAAVLQPDQEPGSPHRLVLADAAHHAPSRAQMLTFLQRDQGLPLAQGVWHSRVYAGLPHAADTGSKVLTAEQSNTSIIFSAGVIFKLFRRLQAGCNPDLEMTHHLTVHRGFTCVPPLVASLHIEMPEHLLHADQATGTDAVVSFDAGMLQTYVDQAEDGFGACHREVTQWLLQGPSAEPPGLQDAATLGRTTRALHEALAHPAAAAGSEFAPRRATGRDWVSWLGATVSQCDTALQALQRALQAGTLQQSDAPLAQRVLQHCAAVATTSGPHIVERRLGLPKDLATTAQYLGLCIRHHGDYHLGQVLRRRTGEFVLLDFEGEPLRPLEQRRLHHCALRDVAGMLRSYAYAAHTGAQQAWAQGGHGHALQDLGAARDKEQTQQQAGAAAGKIHAQQHAGAGASQEHMQQHAAAAQKWLAGVSTAFVTAYRAAPSSQTHAEAQPLLPSADSDVQALLTMFSLEKALYELCYELSHRPDWVTVPLRAVATQLGVEELHGPAGHTSPAQSPTAHRGGR